MVELYYGEKGYKGLPAHLVQTVPGIKAAVKEEAAKVETKAEMNLISARATTTHTRIEQDRAHETEIKLEKAPGRLDADWLVSMYGVNPMALEFGHFPSGYFDPDKYGSMTKSPSGLYILSRAGGFPVHSVISDRWYKKKKAARKKNKRKKKR